VFYSFFFFKILLNKTIQIFKNQTLFLLSQFSSFYFSKIIKRRMERKKYNDAQRSSEDTNGEGHTYPPKDLCTIDIMREKHCE
jgi:hypothetical protein